MRLRNMSVIASVVLLCATILATPAAALPATGGVWQLVPAAGNDAATPYSNLSWDCEYCNLGYLLPPSTVDAPAEYLHAPFTFPAAVQAGSTELFAGITAFQHNTLTVLPSGGIRLTNDEGRTFDSDGDGWENFMLVRWVTPFSVTTLLAFEDLLDGDFDFNDGSRIVSEQLLQPPPPTPRDVPEPATVATLGLGLLAISRRLKRRF